MTAKIKVDPAKLPAPRLEPSYQKRVKVADSFDRHIQQLSERQDRLYNWKKVHPPSGKKKRKTQPTVWTERRLEELIRLVNAGASNQEIADALHLQKKQIHLGLKYARKMGAISERKQPQHNAWRKKDDELLISLYKSGIPEAEIAKEIGRSIHSVSSRLYDLRQHGHDIPVRDWIRHRPADGSGHDRRSSADCAGGAGTDGVGRAADQQKQEGE